MSKEKVRNQILNDINNGVYPEKSKFPSERDLAKKYNVPKLTISTIRNELVHKGVITSGGKSGSYITPFYRTVLQSNIALSKLFKSSKIIIASGSTFDSNVEFDFTKHINKKFLPSFTSQRELHYMKGGNTIAVSYTIYSDTINVKKYIGKSIHDFIYEEEIANIKEFFTTEKAPDNIRKTLKTKDEYLPVIYHFFHKKNGRISFARKV